MLAAAALPGTSRAAPDGCRAVAGRPRRTDRAVTGPNPRPRRAGQPPRRSASRRIAATDSASASRAIAAWMSARAITASTRRSMRG